jgi:hypothetical protein
MTYNLFVAQSLDEFNSFSDKKVTESLEMYFFLWEMSWTQLT